MKRIKQAMEMCSQAKKLVDSARVGDVHFVGIGGVGMAGLAHLLHRMGWSVSGCDECGGGLLSWLEREGIRVHTGHDPAHLGHRPDFLVRTPAVHDDNPELAAARAAGIPIAARGEVLAALGSRFPTVAVCGSHGKTTTSTFLATILRSVRPDATAWCIGGSSAALPTVAGMPSGTERPTLVVEADESDGTLALYRPVLTVITNIDLDHVDRFATIADFEQVFRSAIDRTDGPLVYCADHPRTVAVAMTSHHRDRLSFGFAPNADVRISDFEPTPEGGIRFRIAVPGTPEPIAVVLPVPGRHNALNAAAAIAAATRLGIAPADAARALASTALPARRFERIGSPDGFTVVSDYSHHPAEIRALVATAKGVSHERIVAVFQPHRFTRTKTLLAEFPAAFRGVDELVLCPVYAASEDKIPGGTASDLYAEFRRRAAEKTPDAEPIPVPILAEDLAGAANYLCATVRPGDLVLVVGAGDVNTIAPVVAAAHPAADRPTAFRLSAYGTAAIAPKFRIVPSPEALREALAEARTHGETPALLGAGTNTLVAPTGCHRPLLRLRGDAFSFIRNEDAQELSVGTATPGPTLLEHCAKFGLSGLECMAGIPGYVGGWLAQNAGTRYGSFCDRVVSVRALRPDGTECELTGDQLQAGYRECPGLAGLVALSVRLRLSRTTEDDVRAKLADFACKRLDFTGLRTCGSVFRNPPAPALSAGALSDRAFCKGLRIGGAIVTARHGNVISTDSTATASDVLALVHIVQDRVEAAHGIRLEPELRILR